MAERLIVSMPESMGMRTCADVDRLLLAPSDSLPKDFLKSHGTAAWRE